jgi:hypothetical protein
VATEARRRAQAKYNSKPEQVKRRAARNKARRMMIKQGRARRGDGKDVGHANGNPLDNRKGNLRMETKAGNRSLKRTRAGHKKNPRD